VFCFHDTQLMKTQRHLELLLEELPCETDPSDYYETTDQLLEPLLLCYDSLVINITPNLFLVPLHFCMILYSLPNI